MTIFLKLLFIFFIFFYIKHTFTNKKFSFINERKIIDITNNTLLKNPIFIYSKKDNIKLALYEFFEEKNNNEFIIFIPGGGFYGNSLYQSMAKIFFENNRNIILIDLRGHGNSEGDRGDTPSVDHIMQDIKTIIEYYKNKYKNCKIILSGHSSGAGTCINYSQTKNIQPDEYFFITPYLGSNNKNIFKKSNFIKKIRWYLYLINNIISIDYLKHIKTVFFNYDHIDRIKNPLIVDTYSYQMSLATTPYDSNLINKIKIPTTILLAENDELFNNDEILKITKKNTFIKTEIVPNSSHLDILLNKNILEIKITKETIINSNINCTFYNPSVIKSSIPVICVGGSEGGTA